MKCLTVPARFASSYMRMPVNTSRVSPIVKLSVFTQVPYTPCNASLTEVKSSVDPFQRLAGQLPATRRKERTLDNLYAFCLQIFGTLGSWIACQRTDGIRRWLPIAMRCKNCVNHCYALGTCCTNNEDVLCFGHVNDL